MKKEEAYPEEPGYRSVAGCVKGNPANNAHYVEQYKDWDWYPIIKHTADELERIVPGYNISQIKDKFGGLRFYISYPNPIVIPPNAPPWLDTPEKVKGQARKAIACAEAWVWGFEAAKRSFRNG